MVVYLVRSFRTYARIRSLTTGTFNLVVKDRIAFRLSGANSVQANPLLERIRLSSKPFKHIVRAKPCQRMHPTAFPRVFPQWKLLRMGGGRGAKKLVTARNDIAFRSGICKDAEYSAHAEAEDRKLRKDPSWRSLL